MTREEIVIERRPVSKHATDAQIHAGSTEIHIPVSEERVHVEKETVVKEEVKVGKRKVTDTEEVSGTVRKDKVGFGLSLSAQAEMIHPGRRHNLTASPYIEMQIGGHIDLSVSFSVTKRELPAPNEAKINKEDFALQSRLSYAEPLSLNGSLNLTIHWDRTNGARNDRFENF